MLDAVTRAFNAYFLNKFSRRPTKGHEFLKLRFAAQIPCLFRTRHP